MAYSKGDDAFVLELLETLGPISNRPMFGCGALYADGLLFGLIDDGVFYLRADDQVVGRFKAAGSRQFTYPSKDGDMNLGYWTLPDEACDDPEAAVEWARLSLDAARRKAAAKKPKKPGKAAG
jgi:DNA transformation protein